MKPKILALTTLVLVSLVVLAACGASGHKTIKATDYASSDWELLVEEAELHCKVLNVDLSAVWVEHDGKLYALNGFAMRLFEDQGLVNIRRAGANQDASHYYYGSKLIWKPTEPYKNILNSPLMCEGVALCGKKHWGACPD